MTDVIRDGCNRCGWHSGWHPRTPVGNWHVTLEVMGHVRDRHPDVYELMWEADTRRAFEAGILHQPEFELIAEADGWVGL